MRAKPFEVIKVPTSEKVTTRMVVEIDYDVWAAYRKKHILELQVEKSTTKGFREWVSAKVEEMMRGGL
jgi:hypothetical protein